MRPGPLIAGGFAVVAIMAAAGLAAGTIMAKALHLAHPKGHAL
jgi:hypothetical protein